MTGAVPGGKKIRVTRLFESRLQSSDAEHNAESGSSASRSVNHRNTLRVYGAGNSCMSAKTRKAPNRRRCGTTSDSYKPT
jgi:hypothetical protein